MKRAPHISWLLLKQTQARDDIDGLMQERRNSIANGLEHVFLAPSHPYKECHLYTPPPPFIISFNAMKSIWQCLELLFLIRDTQTLPPLPILILIVEGKLTLSSHSTLFPRYVIDIVLL